MQLFKSSKDFQLDKDTFVNLRWIAQVGQFLAIVIVKFILNFQFPEYLYCFAIIGLGILTNLYLKFKGNSDYSFWILSTRMAPPIAMLIPFYVMYNNARRNYGK